MKSMLQSISYVTISTGHYLINKLQKMPKIKGILYTYYDDEKVVEPIMNKLPGTSLHTLSVYKKRSLINRKKEQNHFNFNNIIESPFKSICFSEKEIRKKFADYMCRNQKIFLKKNRIKAIVMIDEFSLPNSALTKAAKELEIPTIALQHGVIHTADERYDEYRGYIEYKNRRDPHTVVDHIITYSEREKEYLTGGKAKYKIAALGCPRYDSLKKRPSEKEKQKLRKQLGINPKRKIIVWATQTHHTDKVNPKETPKTCEALFSYFARHKKEYEFIIKLHPNENQNAPIYKKYNKKYGRIAKIMGGEIKTNDLLKISELLIIKHSTVGAEAILQNVPIMLLELEKGSDLSVYTEEGITNILDKAEKLEDMLKKIFSSKGKWEFKKFRTEYIKKRFNNFGSATGNVVNFIKKITK